MLLIRLLLLLSLSMLWAQDKKPTSGDPAGPAVAGHVVPLESGPLDSRSGQILYRNAAEQVWGLTIHVPDSTFIKLYFENYRLAKGDTLEIYDLSGSLRQRILSTGPSAQSEFWSLSIPGDTAWLEIRSRFDYRYRDAFQITRAFQGNFDLFGMGEKRSACSDPRALDYRAAWCYSPGQTFANPQIWSNATASVGVLTIGQLGSGSWCSGSLVSSQDYVLTNQHCIENLAGCATTEFIFNYYLENCTIGLTNSYPLTSQGYYCDASDPDNFFTNPIGDCTPQNLQQLDFAFCHVLLNGGAQSPSTLYPVLEMEQDHATIQNTDSMYIIGHPEGRPRAVSEGEMDFTSTYGLHYTAQTLGGNSGSPIFSRDTHRMIGLHHCGGCNTPSERNRGMFISQIREDLDSRGDFFEPAPRLDFLSIEFSDEAGDNDGLFDFGELIEAQVKVVNNGNLDSTAGTLVLTGPNGVNFVGPTQYAVSALPPYSSSSQELRFQFNFTLDGNVLSCGGLADLVFQLNHDGKQRSANSNLKIGGVSGDLHEVSGTRSNLMIAIPDNNLTGVFSEINLTDQGVVNRILAVEVNVTHTYRGDLIAKLTAPNGAETVLHNRSGGSSANLNFTYGDGTNGTILPAGSFANLQYAPIMGLWRLSVIDAAGGDLGVFNSWSLRIESGELDCSISSAELQAGTISAQLGDNIRVPVTYSGSLGEFGFDLVFDPYKLEYVAPHLSGLANCGSSSLTLVEPGRIRVAADCDGAGTLNELLQLEFNVLAISGEVPVEIENLNGVLSGAIATDGMVNLPDPSSINPCTIAMEQFMERWNDEDFYDEVVDMDDEGHVNLLDLASRLNCPAR